MRGNSESNAKSIRNGAKWKKRREDAREGKAPLTRRLPAWVEERDGKLALIPERAAVVRKIFELSAAGRGAAAIVKTLTAEKVPPFGSREWYEYEDPRTHEISVRSRQPAGERYGSGHWTRAYVALLLKDERVLGRFQPHLSDGTPDGKPIADYFPPVVTAEQWEAVRRIVGERRQPRGQVGKRVELFSGLLKNARDGGSYYVATRTEDGKRNRVLLNTHAAEGRAPCWSFPLPTFEAAVLSLLQEIDPHSILNGGEPDETLTLSAELAGVEASIASIEAEMDAHGESPTLYRRLRQKEARQAELLNRLAAARQKAMHPLSESWGEAQTLMEALENAADPLDARTRLRASLQRIIASIYLLVVPRGRDRLCAVQVWFAGGKKHRDYLIFHRPPKANGRARVEGRNKAGNLEEVVKGRVRDLRRPGENVQALEADLMRLDVDALAAGGPWAGEGKAE
jgi:hypothetical protein